MSVCVKRCRRSRSNQLLFSHGGRQRLSSSQKAADVPTGAEGLFFLPYLTGERTPYPDPLARGTSKHT